MTPKIQLKLFGFFPGFFQRAELSPLLWQQRPQQTAERLGVKPTQEKGVGKVANENSTPPKINIIHLKMMVSKWNLLILGIIFRWTILNFGACWRHLEFFDSFWVKHQSSSHVFWVIQNVSDNKLDDTQKAPVSLRNRKPLKPLGLSSWLSKKSHNSPWYSDTPFQTKSLCIAKAPTQTIIGSLHNFPPTKAGLYNKHGPIFCNPKQLRGSKGHFLAQVNQGSSFSSLFWKKSWANFSITPPPSNKKNPATTSHNVSVHHPPLYFVKSKWLQKFLLHTLTGLRSLLWYLRWKTGQPKGPKVGSSHLNPQNSR